MTRELTNDRAPSTLALTLTMILAATLLIAPRPASAETVPARGSLDGRIRTASYNSDQVYRLRGFVGYQIDLEFESGESFPRAGRRRHRGLGLFWTGQSFVPETQGRESGDQSHCPSPTDGGTRSTIPPSRVVRVPPTPT